MWKHQFKSPRKGKQQHDFRSNETPKTEVPPLELTNFQNKHFQLLSVLLKTLEDRGTCLFTSETSGSNESYQYQLITFLDTAAKESLDEYNQSFICTGIRSLLESKRIVHSVFLEKELLSLNKYKDKELNRAIQKVLSNDAWNTTHLLMMTNLIDHALNSIRMDPDRFKDANAFNFLAGELSFLVFPRDNYDDQSVVSSIISSSLYFSLERRRRRVIKRILRSLLFIPEQNKRVLTSSKRKYDVWKDPSSGSSVEKTNAQKALFGDDNSNSNTEIRNYLNTKEFSNEVEKLLSQDVLLLENSRLRLDKARKVLDASEPK